MRIVIDLQGAQTESRFRGIGRYSLSLAQAIARNRGDHEIIIVLNGLFKDTVEPIRAAFDGLLPQNNIRVWYTPGPVQESETGNTWRREAAELIRESFIASFKPDVVHITSLFEGYVDGAVTSIGRFDQETPVSVSLYDLIPLLNPEQYLKPNPIYERYYLQKIKYLQHANLLLSISEFSRQEGIENLVQHSGPIVNISTASSTIFHPIKNYNSKTHTVQNKFDLSRPFVLYTGGADERKNLQRLIRSYSRISVDLRNTHQLVFAGKIPEGNIKLLQNEARSVGLQPEELLFTGYVTDEELMQLYNLCKLFVFPSWHEGFGLPALEAMSCGAAVIGSNTSSLPEVIGFEDALFDPYSEEAISSKIESVLTNDRFKQILIDRGLKQSSNFSWDKNAKKAIEVFQKLSTEKEKVGLSNHTPSLVAELAKLNAFDKPQENDIVETARCIDLNNKSILQYKRKLGLLTWRIEGPFDSSYSLALLNRETALALNTLGHNVALHSTEGPGDFDPADDFLEKNLIIKKLHSKSYEITSRKADIASRNIYPPRVDDFESIVRILHHYAWEESGFPQEWVGDFNAYLDGMTCLSNHVEKIMIDNGVHIPMQVSGCGVDHWERISASSEFKVEAKEFKFLHVSSCFPRKGVDYLLQAYGQQFTSSHDVSLIIKTFPNPHNRIHQWLEDARLSNPDYPHVVVIEDDLSDSDLKRLYELCDVLVSPSRAEGFGLPMAEAMLSNLPVITTAWGGQLDFCNSENSWLVDYEFERANTHFGLFLSVWADPNIDSLAKAMCDAYNSTPESRAMKAEAGRRFLLSNHKWTDVATRYVDTVSNIIDMRYSPVPKIAWISTWNTKCGIATYSKHLINNMSGENVVVFAPKEVSVHDDDDKNCVRNWVIGKNRNALNQVSEEIASRLLNTIVIQFNYGFYNHQELSQFIEENIEHDRIVILMLHSTVDPEDKLPEENFKLQFILESLKSCHRILVHSVDDLNRLKNIGLVENVALFPHGVVNYTRQILPGNKSDIPLIASYGFCLPHKGLEQLIDAVSILRKQGTEVRLRLVNAEYPASESTNLVESINNRIRNLNLTDLVEFNCQFLDDDESFELLSEADLIVFAYQKTGESSSAAVRYGLATKRPVAVTPLHIFDDISNAAFRLSGTDSASIASGIIEIINSLSSNSELARTILTNAKNWRKEFDYSVVGRRLKGICSSLLQQKNFSG